MTIAEYLERVTFLREGYSDEIPDAILHSVSGDEPPKFKVRKAWFQGVEGVISEGVRRRYLPLEYYRGFHRYVHETNFHSRNTTREDIEWANNLLDHITRQVRSLEDDCA